MSLPNNTGSKTEPIIRASLSLHLSMAKVLPGIITWPFLLLVGRFDLQAQPKTFADLRRAIMQRCDEDESFPKLEGGAIDTSDNYCDRLLAQAFRALPREARVAYFASATFHPFKNPDAGSGHDQFSPTEAYPDSAQTITTRISRPCWLTTTGAPSSIYACICPSPFLSVSCVRPG